MTSDERQTADDVRGHDWEAEYVGAKHFALTCRSCGRSVTLDMDHVTVVPNRPLEPCPALSDGPVQRVDHEALQQMREADNRLLEGGADYA
jgi:hypothetical protein